MTKTTTARLASSNHIDAAEQPAIANPWLRRLKPERREEYALALAKELGPRYAECNFENYRISCAPQRKVFDQVKAFANDMPKRMRQGGGLVFHGRVGTGKDHLMCAVMAHAIREHGFGVHWVNGLDLFMRIRERIRDGGSEEEFVAEYQEPQILALSDPIPPRGDASPFAVATLQQIVDRRYRDLKSTWATLKVCDGDEASGRLAGPLVDRLRHGSLCLPCDWPTYRKAGPTQLTDQHRLRPNFSTARRRIVSKRRKPCLEASCWFPRRATKSPCWSAPAISTATRTRESSTTCWPFTKTASAST